MNPHAVTGTDHDVVKAPNRTSHPSGGSDNLILDDSDVESVTDLDLIPDPAPVPSRGTAAPPISRPLTPEPETEAPALLPSDATNTPQSKGRRSEKRRTGRSYT